MLQKRLENRADVRAGLLQFPGSRTGSPAGVENREIERLLISAQFHEQIEYFVQNRIGPRIRAVDLVDHHDGPKLMLKRLLQDEAGLRHRSLGGIDEQEHPVGHAQDALDFPAEIGVAGGVDQIDLRHYAIGGGKLDRHVLGQDGDSPLALEGIAIEERVLLDLTLAKIAALAQQRVDQRRFAMVDVGDDCDVADVVTHSVHFIRSTHSRRKSPPHFSATSASPPFATQARHGDESYQVKRYGEEP